VFVLSYFRSPFPSTKGFSAYRMPGVAVHGPWILSFSAVGVLLCWPHPLLRPLLIFWVLAGVYLGRDIAILCHYSPLLTLISWAVFAIVLLKPVPIARFGAAHVAIPAVLSAVVGALVFLVAWAMTREKAGGSGSTSG
jgi:hypothetical protein